MNLFHRALFATSFLISASALHAATPSVECHLVDGGILSIPVASNPSVVFDGENVIFRSHADEYQVSFTDLLEITLRVADSAGLDRPEASTQKDSFFIDGTTLHLHFVNARNKVAVYNIAGKQLLEREFAEAGEYSIDCHTRPGEIYIVVVNKTAFKFTRHE